MDRQAQKNEKWESRIAKKTESIDGEAQKNEKWEAGVAEERKMGTEDRRKKKNGNRQLLPLRLL